MISPEELAVLVNTFAIAISKDKDISQLELIVSILTQISDTLATIAIQRSRIEECKETKNSSVQ